MNDKPQQTIELENYKYKTHREQVEKVFNVWLEHVDMNVLMADFFGIDTDRAEIITQEERVKFKMYLRHVSKRIINAYLFKNRRAVFKITEEVDGLEVTRDMVFSEILENFLGSILMHDLSHTALISDTKEEDNNSIVPPFLKGENDVFSNNEDYIKQELYGSMWQILGNLKKPISLLLLNKQYLNSFKKELRLLLRGLKNSKNPKDKDRARDIERTLYKSYESKECYTEAYFCLVFFFVEVQNMSDAYNYADEKFKIVPNNLNDEEKEEQSEDRLIKINSFVRDITTDLERIFIKIKNDKDLKTLEMLEYIWTNKDNPRVLVNLFFRETASYFQKLESRYKIKKVLI